MKRVKIDKKYSADILFSKKTIEKRVSEIARKISKDFEGKDAAVIAVLNGSFIFCADIIRKLNIKFTVDFISLSSYQGTKSQGKIKEVFGLKDNIEGKDVLIVEDIVDSGNTLDFLFEKIYKKNPKSVKTCVLLDKSGARQKNVKAEYSCFKIRNDFVVGYGLDCDGFFRGLPYIAVLRNTSD
jgi:hypoxanthine phosphoribosyltransferase